MPAMILVAVCMGYIVLHMSIFDFNSSTATIQLVTAVLPLPLLAWAAWSDLASRTIPNAACVALVMVGILQRAPVGLWPMVVSVMIAIATFTALVLVHSSGNLGGGDVKLAAAVLFGLSPIGAFRFGVITIYAGGALALLHLALRLLPPAPHAPVGAALTRRVWRAERWRVRRRAALPYGIAIAFGGTVAFLTSSGS